MLKRIPVYPIHYVQVIHKATYKAIIQLKQKYNKYEQYQKSDSKNLQVRG